MPGIDIHHPHPLPDAQARQAVQQIADTLAARFGVECRWAGDDLVFQRTGVDGRIALLPGAVRVTAELGFLLSALQPTIEAEVRRVLAERLA